MSRAAKRGRPPKPVESKDLRIVEDMAGRGATLEDIARVVGVSASTLDRWMAQEEVREAYLRGRAIAKDEVSRRLYNLAMEGDVTAIIFWLKAQAGWTDKPREEAAQTAQVVVYVPDNQRTVLA